MLIKDMMTKDVITVSPETSLREACKIFKEKRISGIPVIGDEGKIVGIVTITDILKMVQEIYQWKELEKSAYGLNLSDLIGKERLNTKVAAIMTKNVHTLDDDKTINDVMRLVFSKKIHTIPIMRDDKLVGIIGKRDLAYFIFER